MRLLRLTRLYRFLEKWEVASVLLSANTLRVLKLASMMIIFSHWDGCLHYLVAVLEGLPQATACSPSPLLLPSLAAPAPLPRISLSSLSPLPPSTFHPLSTLFHPSPLHSSHPRRSAFPSTCPLSEPSLSSHSQRAPSLLHSAPSLRLAGLLAHPCGSVRC